MSSEIARPLFLCARQTTAPTPPMILARLDRTRNLQPLCTTKAIVLSTLSVSSNETCSSFFPASLLGISIFNLTELYIDNSSILRLDSVNDTPLLSGLKHSTPLLPPAISHPPPLPATLSLPVAITSRVRLCWICTTGYRMWTDR